MTQRVKQNYYNVKFLKGYGLSIKVKDSKIVLKDCYNPFKEPEIEEWFINNMTCEKIAIVEMGTSQLRPQAYFLNIIETWF